MSFNFKSTTFHTSYTNPFLEVKIPPTGQWKTTEDCRCGVEWTDRNSPSPRIFGGAPVEKSDIYKVSFWNNLWNIRLFLLWP